MSDTFYLKLVGKVEIHLILLIKSGYDIFEKRAPAVNKKFQ